MKLFVCGNCQSEQILASLRAMLPSGIGVMGARYAADQWKTQTPFTDAAGTADVLITNISPARFDGFVDPSRILRVPHLYFGGLHPDFIQIKQDSGGGEALASVLTINGQRSTRRWFSAICLWAFKRGLSIEQTAALYTAGNMNDLGYFDLFNLAAKALGDQFTETGVSIAPLLPTLHSRTVFMRDPEHPKLPLSAGLSEAILQKLQIKPLVTSAWVWSTIADPLATLDSYPCYPPIAEFLGVPGSWHVVFGGFMHTKLETYIKESFHIFRSLRSPDLDIDAERLASMDKVLT